MMSNTASNPIKKTISRVHYISQGKSHAEQLSNIKRVLDSGTTWLQLRWKEAPNAIALEALAREVKDLCTQYNATYIINDHATLAGRIAADGVHLGLNDQTVASAREMLGNNAIIGGTANTLNDVLKRIAEGCDYIGVGPFRFTDTKQNLSPILGLAGYQRIIDSLSPEALNSAPIIAIGGIISSDIDEILSAGVYGVAVSKLLTESPSILNDINTTYERTNHCK